MILNHILGDANLSETYFNTQLYPFYPIGDQHLSHDPNKALTIRIRSGKSQKLWVSLGRIR